MKQSEIYDLCLHIKTRHEFNGIFFLYIFDLRPKAPHDEIIQWDL